jgi:hypothetical protein
MSNNFETAYSCFEFVEYVDKRRADYDPICDALAQFKGKPFTVREVGEYMMGEDYHKKSYDLRTSKARDLTAQITALLQAMKKHRKVQSWQTKDYAHPRTVEDYAYGFEVNGVAYPDTVEVTTVNGDKLMVPTQIVYPRAKRVERKVTKTVYPKVTYYQFV